MLPNRTYEKPIDQIVAVPIPMNGAVTIVTDMFESYPVCYDSSIGHIPLKMKEGYTSSAFSLSTNGKSVTVNDMTKRLSMLYVMEYGGVQHELSADNASSLSENGD